VSNIVYEVIHGGITGHSDVTHVICSSVIK